MKPVLVESSVLCRLCSICIILRTKARVEIITCTIWVKPTGSCDVDFMGASCTARLALWKKKLLVFDFYWNWWLLKEPFFFFSREKGTTFQKLFLDARQLSAAHSANDRCTWRISPHPLSQPKTLRFREPIRLWCGASPCF